MNDKKLYVFDVGNTLVVKPCNTINELIVNELSCLKRRGDIVGVASMRNKTQYELLRKNIDFDFYIGLNGSYVELYDKAIIEQPIDRDGIDAICKFVFDHKIHCLLHTKEAVIPFEEKCKEPVFAVELFEVGHLLDDLACLLNARFNYHVWELGKSCDIYSKAVSKRIALELICKYLDVSGSNCIAFGDGFNDIELFKFCGKSVAMETAPADLKRVATYVTKSAKDDGVLWALNKWNL